METDMTDLGTWELDAEPARPNSQLPAPNSRGAAANGIWWLASYPKSGNTWVRMFLNAAITRFPVRLNSVYQYVAGDLTPAAYQSVLSVPLGQIGNREAIYCRPAALVNQLAQAGRDVCLKTHHANLSIDDIPLCPAKLSKGAVYLVRDPRDVCLSFARHMGVSVDQAIDMMARPHCTIAVKGGPLYHYLSSWSAHVRSWLDDRNPITTGMIRYEDLLADPWKAFRDIRSALGLDDAIDDDALRFGIEQTEFDRLRAAEQKHGFAETGGKQKTFFHAGRSERWRTELTPDQVSRIERDHGPVMTELGYAVGEQLGDRSSELGDRDALARPTQRDSAYRSPISDLQSPILPTPIHKE
jgi:hypothetical protein